MSVSLGRNGSIRTDLLVVEEPLAIRVNQRPIAVVLRTPTGSEADLDLAIGFLLTEGVIDDVDDIQAASMCTDPVRPHRQNVVQISLHSGTRTRADRLNRAERNQFVGSSCGVCGKASMDRVFQHADAFMAFRPLASGMVRALPNILRDKQHLFRKTGGLHGAGIFNRQGACLFIAEDVGRHNAVDKVIGQALRSGQFPVPDAVLVVSSRAGFEIVQKAVMARIDTVVSVGAASSLADDLARESRVNLYSFVRDDGFNSHQPGS